MQQKELLVSAIKNGTVIDHISSGQALKIVSILKLSAHKKLVTIGLNLPSKALKYKDLIKVEGKEMTPEEANQVAIVAPLASVNIIRNYKIVKKFNVELPKVVEHFAACPNPKCITNHEQVGSVFYVKQNGVVQLHCKYCEKIFKQEEINL